MEEVKARVPEKQLLVFNVKQGWEPLCRCAGPGGWSPNEFLVILKKECVQRSQTELGISFLGFLMREHIMLQQQSSTVLTSSVATKEGLHRW
jgi:hypothetical protein